MVFPASLFTKLWEVDGCVCLQCLISIDLGGDGVVLVLITTQGRKKNTCLPYYKVIFMHDIAVVL